MSKELTVRTLREFIQETKDWDRLLTYALDKLLEEDTKGSYVELAEEAFKTKIKDAEHLRKVTGLKERPLKDLERIITDCKYGKYSNALIKAIGEGATYKDLLKMKPKDYGLPETWEGCLASDHYSAILWAIELAIGTEGGRPSIFNMPNLRSIAEEIEAPYSVVMDCYCMVNIDR